MDIDKLTTPQMKMFNDLLDEVRKDKTNQVPFSVIARRFTTALEVGINDPKLMRQLILGRQDVWP